MLNRQAGNKVKKIELMGKKYEKLESFKYLGAIITSLNDIETGKTELLGETLPH
jgi:hypothetical protein